MVDKQGILSVGSIVILILAVLFAIMAGNPEQEAGQFIDGILGCSCCGIALLGLLVLGVSIVESIDGHSRTRSSRRGKDTAPPASDSQRDELRWMGREPYPECGPSSDPQEDRRGGDPPMPPEPVIMLEYAGVEAPPIELQYVRGERNRGAARIRN